MEASIDYAALADSLQVKASKDGEVSLSVDETNALRLKLGLKPLNSAESSSESVARRQAERNYELAQSSKREARRLGEIEAELARARRRREARRELKGVNDLSSADDEEWLARTRLEAERRDALLMDQEESIGEELEGVEVSGAAAVELKRGESRILTLADEQILDYDAEKHGKLVGLRQDSKAVLENIDATEAEKRRQRTASLRRDAAALRGLPTDDDEFDDPDDSNVSSFRLKLGPKGSLSLNDQSHLTANALARVAESFSANEGERNAALPAEGDVAASVKIGLGTNNAVFTSQRDYMTADEARKLFKKKKGVVKTAHKKRKTSSLVDIADDNDRGSRANALERRARARASQNAEEESRRRAAFDLAKQKQQAKVDQGFGKKMAPSSTEEAEARPAEPPPRSVDDEPAKKKASTAPKFADGLGEDEDDHELRASLARARTLNLRKSTARQDAEDHAKRVADRIHEEKKTVVKKEEVDDALVFTNTTEFTGRLHARIEERAAEVLANGDRERGGDDEDEPMEDLVKQEEEDEKSEKIDFLHNQPLAANGMAATMALLQTSGDLTRAAKQPEIMVGRARDETVFADEDDDVGAPRDVTFKGQLNPVKIEYRDADGRLLTRKEAYRQLCWKFHGKTPGSKKLEKAAARLDATQRSIKQGNAAGSLAILQHAQQRTGRAYIPINNTADMANNLVGNKDAKKHKSSSKQKRDHR